MKRRVCQAVKTAEISTNRVIYGKYLSVLLALNELMMFLMFQVFANIGEKVLFVK